MEELLADMDRTESNCLDEEGQWDGGFEEDNDDNLDRFDLGVYAGALN